MIPYMYCCSKYMLYQLNYQANWELVMLGIHNVPMESEEYV